MEHVSDMQRWSVPNSIGVITLVLLILFANNVVASDQNSNSVQRLDTIIIDTIPHSNTSWTQGLLINDGYLYESTGKYGESGLQKINMSNGEIEKSYNHNESIFAEGLTYYDNKLIQLTYRSNIAFVFDVETWMFVELAASRSIMRSSPIRLVTEPNRPPVWRDPGFLRL